MCCFSLFRLLDVPLSDWRGTPACQNSGDGCVEGLPPRSELQKLCSLPARLTCCVTATCCKGKRACPTLPAARQTHSFAARQLGRLAGGASDRASESGRTVATAAGDLVEWRLALCSRQLAVGCIAWHASCAAHGAPVSPALLLWLVHPSHLLCAELKEHRLGPCACTQAAMRPACCSSCSTARQTCCAACARTTLPPLPSCSRRQCCR